MVAGCRGGMAALSHAWLCAKVRTQWQPENVGHASRTPGSIDGQGESEVPY